MQIYFVRHGKTEWNLARRFQGAHGDSPLLKQSSNDIAKLGQYLAPVKFSAIYSSPLKRAVLTANGIVSELQCPEQVIQDERLREFDLGDLEGMNFEQAKQKFPEQITNFWHHPEQYNGEIVHGESYEDVIARGRSFAADLTNQFKAVSDKILVVSHGAALSAIMGELLGYPLKDIRQNGGVSNASLSILETLDSGRTFKILTWNKTDYLGRKLAETDSL